MKRDGGLFEKIVSFENLYHAAQNAFRRKKMKESVSPFYFHMETEVLALQQRLVEGKFYPAPYTVFEIGEPKVRQICSAPFRERVVHHAICHVLDPIFERRFIFDTYACRRGKGQHAAVRRAQDFVRRATRKEGGGISLNAMSRSTSIRSITRS